MTLSTTSRFVYAGVNFSSRPIFPSSVAYKTTEGDRGRISFYDGWPTGADDLTALGILQEIYASTDGYLDADGNALSDDMFYVWGSDIPPGTTIANMEARGLVNPFIAGGEDRWLNARQVDGAFLLEAEVEEDSQTGRRDIVTKGGVRFNRRVPTGGMLTQFMEDWICITQAGFFDFHLFKNPDLPFDFDTLVDDDIRIRAMLVWLNSVRTSGEDALFSDIGDVHSSLDIANALSGHMHSYNQRHEAGQTSNVKMGLNSSAVTASRVSIRFAQATDSPNDLVTGYHNLLFDNTSVTVATDNADEEPLVGSKDVREYARRLITPTGELSFDVGFPVWTDKETGQSHTVGSSAGIVIDWETLPGVIFSDVPLLYNLAAIHDATDGNDTNYTNVPTGQNCVPNQGEAIEFEIHNRRATGLHIVRDRHHNDLITLSPGEHVALRVLWLPNGDTEVRSIGEIVRTYELVGTNCGDFLANGYFADPEGASTRVIRPFQIPPDGSRGVDHLDSDSFRRGGSGTWTDGDALTDVDIEEAVQFEMAGRARIEFEAVMAPTGSGNVSNGNGLLFALNGDRVGPIFYYSGFDGNSGSQIYNATIQLDVAEDDRFIPFFRYNSSGLTMSLGDLNLDYYRLRIDLAVQIEVTQ
jgi:hypothetical protein